MPSASDELWDQHEGREPPLLSFPASLLLATVILACTVLLQAHSAPDEAPARLVSLGKSDSEAAFCASHPSFCPADPSSGSALRCRASTKDEVLCRITPAFPSRDPPPGGAP